MHHLKCQDWKMTDKILANCERNCAHSLLKVCPSFFSPAFSRPRNFAQSLLKVCPSFSSPAFSRPRSFCPSFSGRAFSAPPYYTVVLISQVTITVFRPHRTQEIWTIATDVSVAWCVFESVCLFAKAAAQIEVLFGMESGDFWETKKLRIRCRPPPPTARGREFDAAFAKLLWPLVIFYMMGNSVHKMLQYQDTYNFKLCSR